MTIRVSRTDRTGRQLDHREAAKRIGLPARYLGSKPDYFLFDVTMPSSCAICTALDAALKLVQIDAGDPLVAVCHRCNDEPAVEKRGPERGFEPNGGLLTVEESRAAAHNMKGVNWERDTREILDLGRAPAPPRSKSEVIANQVRFDSKRDAWRAQQNLKRHKRGRG